MNEAADHFYGFAERTGDLLERLNLQRYAVEASEVHTLAGERVPEDDQPFARILRGEVCRNVELFVTHHEKDETRVFVSSGSAVDIDPPVCVLTIRDETEPAPTLIARLEDEQILRVNTGRQEMLGSDKSDVVGRSLSEVEELSPCEIDATDESLVTSSKCDRWSGRGSKCWSVTSSRRANGSMKSHQRTDEPSARAFASGEYLRATGGSRRAGRESRRSRNGTGRESNMRTKRSLERLERAYETTRASEPHGARLELARRLSRLIEHGDRDTTGRFLARLGEVLAKRSTRA